jgi:hypothetical protein
VDPPQVSASVQHAVLEMMIKFPLEDCLVLLLRLAGRKLIHKVQAADLLAECADGCRKAEKEDNKDGSDA